MLLKPVDAARGLIGTGVSVGSAEAGTPVGEGAPDGATGPPAGPWAGAGQRPRRAVLVEEPVLLVATDATAVLVLAARSAPWLSSLVLAALSVAVLAALRLYRPKLILSAVDDAFRIVAGVAVAWALHTWLVGKVPAPSWLDVDWLWCLAVAGCVVLARAFAYVVLRRRRARRPNDVVLVGCSPVLVRLAWRLPHRPQCGLRPVGFVSRLSPEQAAGLPLPVLGTVGEMDRILAETRAEHVIVGFGAATDGDLIEPLRRLRQEGRTVFVVPRLFELNVGFPNADAVDGIPLVRLPPAPCRRWTWLAKRPLDLVGAAVALVVAAPLFGACAVAVRRESGRHGVLFRQRRVGQHGRPFPIVKFRSLTPGSEVESQVRWSVAHDGRVGPVGRLLRRTSLDELPQLVNVLRGEMSLVGPRPERPYFVDRFGARYRRYRDRLRVPPGMTGWAQVHGLRGDTSIEDRATFDNYYIENWSLALDLKIMLRTVGVLLRPGSGDTQ